MKPHTANLLNAATLIVMGLWGYFSNDARPITALIPVIGGVLLFLMNNGVKSENKTIAHIAVLLTLLMIISIAVKPFRGAVSDGDTLGMIRTGAMIITGIIAMVSFIGSFRAARKAREAGQ